MNTEERKRLRKLAEYQITCALAWEPDDRLIGNMRAADAARVGSAVFALLKSLDEAEKDLAALRQEIAGYEVRQAEAVTGAEEANRELTVLRERVAVLERAAMDTFEWASSNANWRERCQSFDEDMGHPIRDFHDEEEWDRLEAQSLAHAAALRAALEPTK